MSKFVICAAMLAMAIGLVSPASAATVVYSDPTVGVANQEAQETAFLAATGALTMIDFDNFAPFTILAGNEYQAQGILFSQPGGYQIQTLDTPEQTSRSEPNSLFPTGAATIDERLQLDLITPQLAVGLWVIDSEFSAPNFNESLDFFDGGGNLIVSVSLPRTDFVTGGPEGNFFIGVVSDTPIGRVILNEAPNEAITEDVGWDNVYFGVPEPASLLLLGVGALALRRRP